ncbi:MAG: histidine phosphatase family protein [Gemmataceae bacterium]|nr:histidine phosphatase family protein [Gemmataceae bacterium]
MMRIYLLRHAESATPNVFHGAESDVELSAKGRRQAELVADTLAPLQPDAVVSSGMRRAIDTATPLAARLGMTLQIEPALHERKVAGLSGMPHDAMDNIWAETVKRWTVGETSFTHEGAESFDAIRDRIVPAWQRLAEQHVGRTVVIVAHGIVCRVLLLSILPGWTVADWEKLGPIRNIAINELTWDGEAWIAERLNDVPGAIGT